MKFLASWAVAVLSLLSLASALQGQSASTADLRANTNSLRGTMTLDRSVYFPFEEAVITIAVANPTGAPRQTFAPFLPGAGCINLYLQVARTWVSSVSDRICPELPDSKQPVTVYGSGETRVKTLGSIAAAEFNGGGSPFPRGGVPEDPAVYRLDYSYLDSLSADFQVVLPRLEASAVARVQDVSYIEPGSSVASKVATYMHAFAVRWNGMSFVCVTRDTGSISSPQSPDGNGNLSLAPMAYQRIAGSPNPITSITLNSSHDGNLTVAWTDSTGQTYTISGNAPALAGDVDPLQIWIAPSHASLFNSRTQQFNVVLANAASTGMNWSVSLDPGAPAGVQAGTISNSGLYTAPASISAPYNVIVTAQSQIDPAKSAMATIALAPPVAVATTFNPPGGNYTTAQTVAISTVTPGASIRYTTNGSQPSKTAGVLYTGPITVRVKEQRLHLMDGTANLTLTKPEDWQFDHGSPPNQRLIGTPPLQIFLPAGNLEDLFVTTAPKRWTTP